jgi:hypothetical protein
MVLTRIRRILHRHFGQSRDRNAARDTFRPSVEAFEPRTLLACATPPAQCFVTQLYRDVLHREVDPTGLSNWTQALNGGLTRQQVARALTASQEYRTLVVQAAYSTFLGRTADTTGLNNFVAFLSAGGSVEQMHTAIIASAEYSLRGDNVTVAGFLRSLYRDVLGRPIDQAGENAFTLLLAGGASRATVASIVVTSLERASNLVRGYYLEFLRREADSGGLTFFVTALKSGTRQEQVISIIVGSAEYLQRI